jgi:hypothetical protein
MANKKLTQKDEKFIQDLMEDKGSFFFKGRQQGKKHGRGGSGSFGIGLEFGREFVGVRLNIGTGSHRFGYSRD